MELLRFHAWCWNGYHPTNHAADRRCVRDWEEILVFTPWKEGRWRVARTNSAEGGTRRGRSRPLLTIIFNSKHLTMIDWLSPKLSASSQSDSPASSSREEVWQVRMAEFEHRTCVYDNHRLAPQEEEWQAGTLWRRISHNVVRWANIWWSSKQCFPVKRAFVDQGHIFFIM